MTYYFKYVEGMRYYSHSNRFESGNLAKAVRITDTYYELQLRPDLYTDRHCQWFYFRVQVSQDCENLRPAWRSDRKKN